MALEVIYLEDQALFFMSKLRLEKTVQKLFQPQIQVETEFFFTRLFHLFFHQIYNILVRIQYIANYLLKYGLLTVNHCKFDDKAMN